MKRNLLFSMLSVFFLIAGTTAAQTTDHTNYYGNLLRIPMSADTLSPADTLGSWEDVKYWENARGSDYPGRQYSFYYGHLSLKDHSYLFKQKEWYMFYTYMESYGGNNLLETEGEKTDRGFSLTDVAMGDVQPPLQIEITEVIPAPSGSWLFNGSLGNAFLGNDDSLHLYYGFFKKWKYGGDSSQAMEENLVYILGRVGDRYLGAFATEKSNPWSWNNEPEYRLVDLSNSPKIEVDSPAIKFYGAGSSGLSGRQPSIIRQMYNDLYLAQDVPGPGLSILRFADTSFNYVKGAVFHTDDSNIRIWQSIREFKNGKFYFIDGTDLCSYELSLSDTTFVNRKVLMQVP
ncbi:MAG: hypothetical protein ACM34K_08750 [Bacillota bacterium]